MIMKGFIIGVISTIAALGSAVIYALYAAKATVIWNIDDED